VETAHEGQDASSPVMSYHDDQRALEAILTAIPLEIGAPLADKVSTKEAWDSIAATYINIDRVRQATLHWLCRD